MDMSFSVHEHDWNKCMSMHISFSTKIWLNRSVRENIRSRVGILIWAVLYLAFEIQIIGFITNYYYLLFIFHSVVFSIIIDRILLAFCRYRHKCIYFNIAISHSISFLFFYWWLDYVHIDTYFFVVAKGHKAGNMREISEISSQHTSRTLHVDHNLRYILFSFFVWYLASGRAQWRAKCMSWIKKTILFVSSFLFLLFAWTSLK